MASSKCLDGRSVGWLVCIHKTKPKLRHNLQKVHYLSHGCPLRWLAIAAAAAAVVMTGTVLDQGCQSWFPVGSCRQSGGSSCRKLHCCSHFQHNNTITNAYIRTHTHIQAHSSSNRKGNGQRNEEERKKSMNGGKYDEM